MMPSPCSRQSPRDSICLGFCTNGAAHNVETQTMEDVSMGGFCKAKDQCLVPGWVLFCLADFHSPEPRKASTRRRVRRVSEYKKALVIDVPSPEEVPCRLWIDSAGVYRFGAA